MKQPVEKASWWRKLLLIPIAVIAVVLIVASGGGGGEEDALGDFGDEPPIIRTPLNFLLASLPDDQGEPVPLVVTAGSDLTVTVNFTQIVYGTVDLTVNADNTVIFDSFSTRDTKGLEITVSGSSEGVLDGTFEFIVVGNRPIETNIGDNPNSGHFEVVTPTEKVTVKILSTTEVQIILNIPGAPTHTYTWDEFMDLLSDDTLDTWQRRASLAANAYELIYELALTVADTLDELETVPVNEDCDIFTGTQPAGVSAQGETTMTWLGPGSGSGEVTPGDSFEWRFTDCWNDEPLDDTDDLIDGVISLENYSEAVTNINHLLEIGFGSVSNGPGGVIFDNLTISETQDDMGVFTIDPDDDITVNGGFALIFQML